MKLKWCGVTCLLLAGGAYAAGAMPDGVQERKADSGMTVLADSKGMTLYVFVRDTVPGKSKCNGPCAKIWPPVSAPADAKDMGDWTVTTRDDHTKQWAYKGKPLYTYSEDGKAGDTKGNGLGDGSWQAATP